MRANSVTFELLQDPPVLDWNVRVQVKGEDFEMRAIPIAATIGDTPIEGLQLDPELDGFVGYLSELPDDGAHLFLGYMEGPLEDTDLTYQADNT
jgi:hypothetical protein